MGSRVGCHLSLEEPVEGLICLGYPLVGLGKRRQVRDEVLVALNVPALFVQGARDPMSPLDLWPTVRSRMSAPHRLHVVEAGNHSLEAGKRHLKATQQTREQLDAHAMTAIVSFLQEHLPGAAP
jgi:hypothetical protein